MVTIRTALLALLAVRVAAYPNYVSCTRDLSTSGRIMGRPITKSSAATIKVTDEVGNVVTSVAPGQKLQLTFSGWASYSYMVLRAQCKGGGACGKFSAPSSGFQLSCDTQLYASGPGSGTATFTASAVGGAIDFRIVWAGGYGAPVSMTEVPISFEEPASTAAPTPASSPCDVYCATMAANCVGGNAQYDNLAACLSACATFPDSISDATSGNSRQCRTYHSNAAASDPAVHCPHAAALSGSGICGSACDAYCNRMLSGCHGTYADRATCKRACATFPAGAPGDKAGNSLACRYYHAGVTPGTTHCPHAAAVSKDNVCGDACDAYCNTIMANCVGANKQYASTAACKKACQTMKIITTPAPTTSGNSLNCRQYHAEVAGQQDPALHCPHAGADGGGVCAETCDTYCTTAMANCVGSNELFASKGECLGVCAGFPSNVTKAMRGNSRQCRVYHAKAAEGDAELHCPHAAAASGGAICSDVDVTEVECEAYCNNMGANCKSEYADRATCMSACAAFPDNSALKTGGNSRQCRLYHSGAPANSDPALHCAHAAVDGGLVCGDTCDAYCNNMLATCHDTDYKYVDAASCLEACDEFPNDATKLTTGNSLQCRSYHALAATTTKDKAHCGHAWPLSAAGMCGTPCEAYCVAAMKHCTGGHTLYADMATCLNECAAFPDGAVDAKNGDSIQCRDYHAGLAKATPAIHCPHAGPEGGELCGDACTTYCSRMKKHCLAQFRELKTGKACNDTCTDFNTSGTAGDTAGNTLQCRVNSLNVAAAGDTTACPDAGNTSTTCADDSLCHKHCKKVRDNCGAWNSTHNTYAAEKDCLDACAYFPTTATVGVMSGNSLQCRNYHADAAKVNASLHCPHAMALSGDAMALSGDDMCGTKCEAYCDRVMANCKGLSQVFSSRALCVAACAAFPDGSLGDTGTNTRECRAYHALVARQAPSLHCPHASTGGGGVCGTDKCTAYCDQMEANCASEFTVSGSFDRTACTTACAAYPDEPSRATSGNSVQCRIYHATVANTNGTASKDIHCPHAGVSGGGVCGTACEVFCDTYMDNCKAPVNAGSPTGSSSYGGSGGGSYGSTTPAGSGGGGGARRQLRTGTSYAARTRRLAEGPNSFPHYFSDRAMCINQCSYFPPGDASDPLSRAASNSLACRSYHAGVAKDDPTLHCPHASPTGQGVCGTPCDFYCDVMLTNCGADDVVPGGKIYRDHEECRHACSYFPVASGPGPIESGDSVQCRTHFALKAADGTTPWCARASDVGDPPAICASACDNYCNIVMKNCAADAVKIFEDRTACLTACADFPTSGSKGAVTGNTIQCRVYHGKAASGNAATHCPHAAPLSGGGQCGSSCEHFCDVALSSCPADGKNAIYKDREQCLEACSYFPEGAPGTTAGNSLTCRLHYAGLARDNPVAYCKHAAATGGGKCGDACAHYCNRVTTNCNAATIGADRTFFKTDAECVKSCSAFKKYKAAEGEKIFESELGKDSGDTVACRTYHAGVARKFDAQRHCSHASPGATERCVTPTGGSAGEESTNVGVVAGDAKSKSASNFCQIEDPDYRCEQSFGEDTDMKIAWIFDEAKDSASFRIVSKGSSWVAFGISEEPDDGEKVSEKMIGTWAVVGTPGIGVAAYTITSYINGFAPDSAVLSQTEVKEVPDDSGGTNTVLKFTVEKMSAISPKHKIHAKGSNMVKFARGPSTEFNPSIPHVLKGAVAINWADGGAEFINTDFDPRLLKAHAVLMTLSWGILLPFGVLIAMTCKDVPPKGWWFKMHRAIQSTGLFVAILAFIIVIMMVQKKNPDGHFAGPHELHMIIGLVVMIIGILQPLNAIFRPHPPAERHDASGRFTGMAEKTMGRTVWEFTHKGLGRFAIVAGMLNVWGGLNIIGQASFAALLGDTFQKGLSYFFFIAVVSAFAFVFFQRGKKAGGYKAVAAPAIEMGSIKEEGGSNKRVSLASQQVGNV